jgi:anti-sigma factor ChrR (cupin superfamily)
MMHEYSDVQTTELASGYALGVLPLDEALAFEEHLAQGCMICAAEVIAFRDICASLALTVPEVEPSPEVRNKILARLAAERQLAFTESPFHQADSRPEPFSTLYAQQGEWKEVSEGVLIKVLYVDTQKRTMTSLYKMLPGAHAVAHQHQGVEECYVIEGDFYVNDLRLGPGDYHRAEPGSIHDSLYSENGNLLLIISPHES